MLKEIFHGGPPIGVLHEKYAKRGVIDEEAPVKATCEVRIEAPVERVWELLSDVSSWGSWHPDIHDIHLDSAVAEDARFTWANGKARIKSTFAVVEAGRELTWTGVSSGAKAIHRHVLTPDGDGATNLYMEESLAGLLLVLFFDSTKLETGMERWLTTLKTTAESAEER